ncbi:uncharacterized protein LOC135200726 [Macrobrachium nipponense]|uniref:uncharacterized protein LOC135200726 n=1 Tax=Macrobrachium nipponense TaxID=159736 RepID=UPI0030C85AFE
MLGNKLRLIKAVPLVIFTAILLVLICYDFENKFTRNYVPATANLSSVSRTRNTVKIKFRHCKALFSLESPAPEEKIEYIYTEKILPNETVGDVLHRKEGAKRKEEVTGIYRDINDVLKKIRNFKYSEPEKYLNEAYHLLAELLPGVVEYDSSSENERESREQRNQSRDKSKHETDRRSKHVQQRTSSRIVEGTLPFVPCSIRGYEDKRQVFTCFQRRIDVQGSLSIHFFGDSKIRNLLHNLLNQIDNVFHFVTVSKNVTRLWSKARSILMAGKKWSDVEIVTPVLPDLRISLSFRTFRDSVNLREDLPEIQQLRKWANLEEPPPDLLILDYTAWSLELHNTGVYAEEYRHTIDVLAILLELHARVVPLLDKISKRTRVLVLPQSRMRPNGEKLTSYFRGAMADFNLDWSESTFLYILQHLDLDFKSLLESRLSITKEILRISEGHATWESLSTQSKANTIWKPSNGTTKAENESSLNSEASYSDQSTTGSPASDGGILSTRHPRVTQQTIVNKASKATASRDYLIPSEEDSGLWFWDAMLPLNLAEIQECEQLVEGGLTEEPLYKGGALRCLDAVHAGEITSGDLSTMLLNLLCNSVLETGDDYCCS